jgi:polysaccharide export outer membrane protein
MAGGPSMSLLRGIQTLFDAGTASGLSDRQLLERFAGCRGAAAEAAFEMMVLRHGPMVLRVCRSVLANPHDAQDAFQATFLVLVRHCRSIRKVESLGSWLFGVASRVAARARVDAARRRAAERRGGLRVVTAVDSVQDGEPDPEEFGPIVQEEVRWLPEKYRAVVVLCYWEGLTQEQAAIQLGIPLGTVRSRLARARDLLRRRLNRRGLAPAGSLAAPAIDAAFTSATPAIPNNLLGSTIKAGANVAAGRAVTEVTSASVAAMVHFVLRRMVMMKLKTVALCVGLIGIGAFGASLAAPQAGSNRSDPSTARGERPVGTKAQPALKALEPYIVEPPDKLLVEVLEALPGRPISGERLVRPDGKISLGFYGEVYVAGLTPIEVKEKVVLHLRTFLTDDMLGLVETDRKTGGRIADPKIGGPKRIAPKDSDRVFVDVTASNSKNYYVLGAVTVPGRMPVTGRETILDAINLVNGLTPQADHANVVLYRPGKGRLRSLRVDIDQIMLGDDLSTNYQLEPGDRLVVPQLPKTELEEAEAIPVRASTQPRRRPGDVRRFERQPSHLDRSPDDAPQPSEPATNRDGLRGVERRLGEVERKLDRILEALRVSRE